MKKFKRASLISDDDVSLYYDTDEDDIEFQVKGTEDKPYNVSCIEGIWRCDCEDYLKAKNKHLGSYLCKHILKCIDWEFRRNNL